jgi:phosphate transport system substrate-binding protein
MNATAKSLNSAVLIALALGATLLNACSSAESRSLAIDSGKGAVSPSRETVEKAEYQPLSRPLFIYVNAKTAQVNPEVRVFVEFYLKQGKGLVASTGYIPLPDAGYHISYVHFQRVKVGTVFGGKAQPNLRIEELLRKTAEF